LSNQELDNGQSPFHEEGGSVIFDKPKSQEEIARQRREDEQHKFARSQVKTNRALAWFTGALVLATLCTIIVGIWQARISHAQLIAMQGQLDEMNRSGEQSTEQTWSAIGNINWMARSMDLSEKQSEKSLHAAVDQFHQDQRAWVGLTGFRVELSPNAAVIPNLTTTDRAVAGFVNSGRTPARDVKGIVGFGFKDRKHMMGSEDANWMAAHLRHDRLRERRHEGQGDCRPARALNHGNLKIGSRQLSHHGEDRISGRGQLHVHPRQWKDESDRLSHGPGSRLTALPPHRSSPSG